MTIPAKARLLFLVLLGVSMALGMFVGIWPVPILVALCTDGWDRVVELIVSGSGRGAGVEMIFPRFPGEWVPDKWLKDSRAIGSLLYFLNVMLGIVGFLAVGSLAVRVWTRLVVNKWKLLSEDEARWFVLKSARWYHLREGQLREFRALEERLGLPSSLPKHLQERR